MNPLGAGSRILSTMQNLFVVYLTDWSHLWLSRSNVFAEMGPMTERLRQTATIIERPIDAAALASAIDSGIGNITWVCSFNLLPFFIKNLTLSLFLYQQSTQL
jgi:hypothetical protein